MTTSRSNTKMLATQNAQLKPPVSAAARLALFEERLRARRRDRRDRDAERAADLLRRAGAGPTRRRPRSGPPCSTALRARRDERTRGRIPLAKNGMKRFAQYRPSTELRVPDVREGVEREADRHHRLDADARDERLRDAGGGIVVPAARNASPVLIGVAQHLLHVEREQEEAAEDRAAEAEADDVRDGDWRRRKSPSGTSGASRASPSRRSPRSAPGEDRQPDRLERDPSGLGRLRHRVDERHEPGGDEDGRERVGVQDRRPRPCPRRRASWRAG